MFPNLASENRFNLNAWKAIRMNSKELLETDLHLEQCPFVVRVSVTVHRCQISGVNMDLTHYDPTAVVTRVRFCVKFLFHFYILQKMHLIRE